MFGELFGPNGLARTIREPRHIWDNRRLTDRRLFVAHANLQQPELSPSSRHRSCRIPRCGHPGPTIVFSMLAITEAVTK